MKLYYREGIINKVIWKEEKVVVSSAWGNWRSVKKWLLLK